MGYLVTPFRFYFRCSYDKHFIACPLAQYEIYLSRHFIFNICTRLKARADIENNIT